MLAFVFVLVSVPADFWLPDDRFDAHYSPASSMMSSTGRNSWRT